MNTNFISLVLNKKLISTYFALKLVVAERGEFYTHIRCCSQHSHSEQACVLLSLLSLVFRFSVKQSERAISHVCLCAEHINRKSRGEATTTHVLSWSLYWDLLWGSDEMIGQFCVWETRVFFVFRKNFFLTVVCSLYLTVVLNKHCSFPLLLD